jgi:type IV secretory pathway VirB10-like protein
MATDLNDLFSEWKDKNDDGEALVKNKYDRIDEDTGDAVEQVSSDLFGLSITQNAADNPEKQNGSPNNIDTNTDAHEDETEKTSFEKLRDGKKVPRLKKNMVLAIITGGIFVFLFVINLFLHKGNEKKQYFDGQGNNVSTGNDFFIGDIMRRPMSMEDDDIEIIESAEFYLRTPPAYESAIIQKTVPVSTGQPTYNPTGNLYSETELLAIKAQIGKEGGYGFVPINTNYYYQEMDGQILSRDEYTRQRIDEIARLTQGTGSNEINNRDRINNGRYSEAGKFDQVNTQAGSGIIYSDDNSIFPGTIIHGILVSRIDTDYPGPIHARVTENVYDSMTGKKLLIPQGTILQGSYSSSSVGVRKVQIAWESMVVNYAGIAYQVSLGRMAGVDKRGRSGISGMLDDHYFEWLKAAGIVTLFTMLNSEISYQTKGQTNQQLRELMDINQGIVGSLGNMLMERAMNIQPTVRVANGTPVSVLVNVPLMLRAFPAIQAEEKYTRR